MKNKILLATLLLLSCMATRLYTAAPGGAGDAEAGNSSESARTTRDIAQSIQRSGLFGSIGGALGYVAQAARSTGSTLADWYGGTRRWLTGSNGTALLSAAYTGHQEIVASLLRAGIDKDYVNSKGETALMLAAYAGHKEVVELLLRAGADKNHTDNDGNTALICAASKDQKEIVELLLHAGADFNKRNKRGNTALMVASYAGHKEVVGLLLTTLNETSSPGLSMPRKSCYITFTQHDYTDAVINAILNSLATKTLVICTYHILKDLCIKYPIVQKQLESGAWLLVQSVHQDLYIIVPDSAYAPEKVCADEGLPNVSTADRARISNVLAATKVHVDYGLRNINTVDRAQIGNLLAEDRPMLSAQQLIESFRQLIDVTLPQHVTCFVWHGHGSLSTFADIPLASMSTLLHVFAEIGTEFLFVKTCNAAGTNLLLLQKALQSMFEKYTRHQAQLIIRPQLREGQRLKAMPAMFDGVLVIEATSDTNLSSVGNIGDMLRKFEGVVAQRQTKLESWLAKQMTKKGIGPVEVIKRQELVKMLSAQELKDVVQALGTANLSALASVRFPGTNTFFRTLDLGEMEIITWFRLQKLRLEHTLVPLLAQKLLHTKISAPVAAPSAHIRDRTVQGLAEQQATAASSSAPVVQTSLQSRLIPLRIQRGIKYVQLFPADLHDICLNFDPHSDPILISKGPGAMQHFIGGIEYTSNLPTVEEALKNFVHKVFGRFYEQTSAGMTSKAWFIRSLRLHLLGGDHVLERLCVMIPSGSTTPTYTYSGREHLPSEQPATAAMTSVEQKISVIEQWFVETLPSEETLFEATAGQESRSILWNLLEQFLNS